MARYVWDSKNKKLIPRDEAAAAEPIPAAPYFESETEDEKRNAGRPRRPKEE